LTVSRSTVLLGVAAALLLGAPDARAKGPDPAAAEALFAAGREAMARGDYAAACKNFEDSHKLDPATGTIFNLANCEEGRGRLASAWQRFTEVVQALPDTDDRRAIARERADALKNRLPYLTLRFARGVPADASVWRDGVEIGAAGLGVPLPVDPGLHELVVRAAGRADKRFAVTLALAERKELVLVAGAPLSAPGGPVGAPETAPSAKGPPFVGYLLAAVGVAGLTLGSVTGVLALDRKATMKEDGCDPEGHTCRTQTGIDAAASGEILANTSTVAFVVGGVSLAGGAYFLFFSGTDTEAARSSRPPATVRGIGVRGAF
jgi:hypothetical protein